MGFFSDKSHWFHKSHPSRHRGVYYPLVCDSFILVLVFCNDFNVGLEGFGALDSYGRQPREVSSLAARGTC